MPEAFILPASAPLRLTGSFDGTRFPRILQWLAEETWTGWLHVGADARIGFLQGAAVSASWRELSGRDAILELFHVESAVFSLRDAAVPEGRPIGSAGALGLAGFLGMDHWRLLAASVYEPADLSVLEAQPEPVRSVLALLDGKRTLCEARRIAGASRTQVVDRVWELVRGGLLLEAAEPRPDGVEPARLESDELPSAPAAPITPSAVPPFAAPSADLRTLEAELQEERKRSRQALAQVARLERSLLRIHRDTTQALQRALDLCLAEGSPDQAGRP